MILGSDAILYINDIPVGCLTGNSLSESISFINTCKTTAKGAKTALGQLYGYSISFEAIMTLDSLMSWEDIVDLGRRRIMIEWAIISSVSSFGEAGNCFLENIELTGSIEDYINFTGTLTGYGEIVNTDIIYRVWYGAPARPVDEATKYVLVDASY